MGIEVNVNSPYTTVPFKDLELLDWFAVKDIQTPYQKLPIFTIYKDAQDGSEGDTITKDFNSMRIQTLLPVYITDDTKVICLDVKLDLTPKQPEPKSE